MNRAIQVCKDVPCQFAVTSDIDWAANERVFGEEPAYRWGLHILRPPELATDEAAMVDVVKHALAAIACPEDYIVLLVQPTQVLRQPKHLVAAIELMQGGSQRVFSVTATESPDKLLRLNDYGLLVQWGDRFTERRQDARPAMRRDGTVYAWRCGDEDPFGLPAVPLIIDPSETTPLDTPEDWTRAEELLRAR